MQGICAGSLVWAERKDIMDFPGWKWLNESKMINENGELVIYAPAKTVKNLRAGE